MKEDVWAAFDFDGTLTRRDTLLPFLQRSFGSKRLLWALMLESPVLCAFAARLVSNEQAKRRLLGRVIHGIHHAELLALGERFAHALGSERLRPETMERLAWHQASGHLCVLVTASLSLYARPWALRMGFSEVIATELEFDSTDRPTGRFIGANCWGPEKSRRLRDLLGTQSLAFAYGNSRGDREMLGMAERAWRVDRDFLVPLHRDA